MASSSRWETQNMNEMSTYEIGSKRAIQSRCPACQLQICKSRHERPHAGLKPAEREFVADSKFDSEHHTVYLCQACAAVLIHSTDVMEPGWRQRR
jgi:hypothetical protein